jgi:prolipoprotein diacylglyceryl transferase
VSPLAYIPSPSENGFHIGPLFVHAYGLAYVFAVTAAILVTRWRWSKMGGDPKLPQETAIWAFPAGLIGGRIYFLITTPSQIPPHWWGPFAIWKGGLGIWGGIAGGVAVGLWYVHRHLRPGERLAAFADAAAPGLLCAQAIGRIGNYFNQELFGKPTTLPWGLKIDAAHQAGLPAQFQHAAAYQPTFLYEIIWNLALAGLLIWLHSKRKVKAPGLFALYVAGYSAFRLFEEQLRIDFSNRFLGQRLNFWIALALCLFGLIWFVSIQREWGLLRRLRRRISGQPDDSGATQKARPEAERVA